MFTDDRIHGTAAPARSAGDAAGLGYASGTRVSRVRFEPAEVAAESANGSGGGHGGGDPHRAAGGAAEGDPPPVAGVTHEYDLNLLAQYRDEWIAATKRKAEAEAEQARALAKIVALSAHVRDGAPVMSSSAQDVVLRSFAAECATHVQISDRSLLMQCSEAWSLATRYPATLAALHSGGLTIAHVRAISSVGTGLPADARAAYESRALELAAELTPGRLRTKLRSLAESLHPEPLDARHERAVELRRVWVHDLEDGMAEIGAEIPAVLAYGIFDRLTRGARATQRIATGIDPAGVDPAVADSAAVDAAESRAAADDPRGLDQIRADIFTDLLLTGSGGAAAAQTDEPTHRTGMLGIAPSITLLLPTGEGAADATLVGYGPIDATTARQLSAAAPGWNRIGLDAADGVIATDRYRITESMRRTLEARDQHCRFPGCRMPTRQCDVDHTIEWVNGGTTTLGNASFLCRRHHALKHPDLLSTARWSVRQEGSGTLIWTSPTGIDHTDHPEFHHAGASSAAVPGAGSSNGSYAGADPPW